MEFTMCALTGRPLQAGELKPIVGTLVEYETPIVGKVKIPIANYIELTAGNLDCERFLIAGICKNRTLDNEEPILLDGEFIRNGYKKLNPPVEFDDKCSTYLKYLYNVGGKENKEFELRSLLQFAIAYSDPEEFTRILDQLKSDFSLTIRKIVKFGRKESYIYFGVKLTNTGKERAKEMLPKMPMFGLVSQEISTGDNEVDSKINHARELFFSEPQTMDKMRSACETLSYVLEPLRAELASFFSAKDVSDFFQIVNTFDVRHNKETTKNIVYPEQLEWVFYTLLNSITTYTKLKGKSI